MHRARLPDVCGGEGLVLAGKEKFSVSELMFLFFRVLGLRGTFLLFFQVLCSHTRQAYIKDEHWIMIPNTWLRFESLKPLVYCNVAKSTTSADSKTLKWSEDLTSSILK